VSSRPTPPPPPPPVPGELDPAAVVLRFLESVGRPAEARFYLDLFRARPREQFAVISIDANVVRDATDAVVFDLRFLAALELFPSVAVGLFQPSEATAHARRLHRRLAAVGVESEILAAHDESVADDVVEAVRRGAVPVVAFAPVEGQGPADRFDLLRRLLARLRTRKLIFLHRPGGLHQGGELVPLVNLTTDVPALVAGRQLSGKETLLVNEVRRLVEAVAPQPLVAAITSPLVLLRELFTVKGAGTLLRRGATIVRHDGWAGVDQAKVAELIAASFGRGAVPEFFARPVARVYREEGWRGAAILTDTPLGAYLTKFVVSPEAQGEGMARDLWDAVAADTPVVFWRARAGNPIHDWYERLCDGLEKVPPWTIYWKGLPAGRIPEAIELVLAQPVDIPPVAPESR